MRTIDGLAPLPGVLVEALRAGHRGSLGEVGRSLVATGPDAALTWVGFRPDLDLAVKTATVFPGNAAHGLPGIHSVVTLFDVAMRPGA